MSVRRIISPANPILRRKATKVKAFTVELQTLIDDMIETMRDAQGSGLAAPQVAQSLRLFVAHLVSDPLAEDYPDNPPVPGLGRLLVIINPEMTRASSELVIGTEACLSIPGYAGEIERHSEITMKFLDRQGQKRKLKTYGWMARVLQHEYDHLSGVLFIDSASKVWRVDEQGDGSAPCSS